MMIYNSLCSISASLVFTNQPDRTKDAPQTDKDVHIHCQDQKSYEVLDHTS